MTQLLSRENMERMKLKRRPLMGYSQKPGKHFEHFKFINDGNKS